MTENNIVCCMSVFVSQCSILIFLEQDQGLESLSNVLDQQRQMALCIGTEVEGQNGE